LAILDAGLSAAMSHQVLVEALRSNPVPPFPCPSIAQHAAQLMPVAQRSLVKLWSLFGARACDGKFLERELAAACDRFNAAGLSSSIRTCSTDGTSVAALGVIRASIEIFRNNARGGRECCVKSRWTSVLVALHSIKVISIEKLLQFVPDIQSYSDFNTCSSARTSGSNVGNGASTCNCHLPFVCSLLQQIGPQSSFPAQLTGNSASSLSPVKRDLKSYINWRVQFALLPPSFATLRKSLGDLTGMYVLPTAAECF
jgi:hypothetical protein